MQRPPPPTSGPTVLPAWGWVGIPGSGGVLQALFLVLHRRFILTYFLLKKIVLLKFESYMFSRWNMNCLVCSIWGLSWYNHCPSAQFHPIPKYHRSPHSPHSPNLQLSIISRNVSHLPTRLPAACGKKIYLCISHNLAQSRCWKNACWVYLLNDPSTESVG
jgi:hypothetical protein